jgi:hypothetical protein
MIRRQMDIAECWHVYELTQERVAREREREKEGGERSITAHIHKHSTLKASTHSTLARARMPSAAVRPNAAEKGVRVSPLTTIQHSTPTRTTSQAQWRRGISTTSMKHAQATKRERE